jgi:hypothetical protein
MECAMHSGWRFPAPSITLGMKGRSVNALVGRLRQMAENKALPIGEAWNALDEAADKIEELERERLCICDVCDALQDSPRSFLAQMKTWAAKVRTANAGAVPRRDSDVGTSPLLAVSESGKA